MNHARGMLAPLGQVKPPSAGFPPPPRSISSPAIPVGPSSLHRDIAQFMSAYSMGHPPQGRMALPWQFDLVCADIFDARISDNGASMNMAATRNAIIYMYDGVPPTADSSTNSIGDLKEYTVECYEMSTRFFKASKAFLNSHWRGVYPRPGL